MKLQEKLTVASIVNWAAYYKTKRKAARECLLKGHRIKARRYGELFGAYCVRCGSSLTGPLSSVPADAPLWGVLE